MDRHQVLVVEDDVQTRNFFCQCVNACDQLTLAAEAGSVGEALGWLADPSHQADVVLTDLNLPDGSGVEVIKAAAQRNPPCDVLVISMFGDEFNVVQSIEAGALGYIHKDSSATDIAQCILQLKAGESPISPMIARRLLKKYIAKPVDDAPAAASAATPSLLSAREQEVLNLISRGFSYAEVADIIHLSIHTVQSHVKRIYSKLAVHSRTEAVYEANRMGLL